MINALLKYLTNSSYTDNWAPTLKSSLNSCLDMFFIAWASRTISSQQIEELVVRAHQENPTLCVKILFWARDCRWGAWERRFFRIGRSKLLKINPEANQLRGFIPEYGRWDDVWSDYWLQYHESIIHVISEWIEAKDWLLAKRLPRRWKLASIFARELKLTPRQYRKLIVWLSHTVEQQMCSNQWSDIQYPKVPSLAFHHYKNAFQRHDSSRFSTFIEWVKNWEAKLNASTLFPYHLYQSYKKWDNYDVIEAQRNLLPQYTWQWSILPICDVSWSMEGLPMDSSVSLGIYLSEHIYGPFQNAFITFSERPKLQYLQWSIIDKFRQLEAAEWWMNTDLQKVFDLILWTCIKLKLPADQLPQKILIISDMEFDTACDAKTNFESIETKYQQAWYPMPFIIFWNVHGRIGNVPTSYNQKYVWLVSWHSPSIITSIMSGSYQTPEELMLEILWQNRYTQIVIK